ncbi:MAG: sulfotransferase family protein [Candidatus Nitrosopumilus sp. bin_68KS]
MYLESPKPSYKRFYQLFIKRHFFGITSPFRVLPDFFVIGAGRTGTTSLYYYLDQHPSLSKSAYDEIGFFDVNYHLGLGWYRSLFPTFLTKFRIKSKTHFFMTYDVTPSYVRRPWIAKRIKNLFPNSKLIIVLRNPVDRAYSHYYLSKNSGETRKFEEVIEEDMNTISKWDVNLKDDKYFATKVENSILARGFYAEQLSIWFKLFSKNQILIIQSENLALQTKNVMNDIFQFLNLPKYEIPNIEKTNVSKKLKMDPKTRKSLIDFYQSHNAKLYEFLNQKFDWDE